MRNERDMKYTYKGFVCRNDKEEEGLKLGVIHEGQLYFMPISDHELIYEQLAPNEANVVICEFRDGTEPVNFKRAQEGEFDEVFIWIYDLVIIKLNEYEGYLSELINEFPDAMKNLSEAVEKAYTEDFIIEKIKEYKDYTEKWVETH